MALQGQLVLRSQALVWRSTTGTSTTAKTPVPQGLPEGLAELKLENMSSGLSTLKPLGSYQLTWQGGESPRLTLQTTQGDLLLQGAGAWRERGFVFEGEASAKPGHEAALSNLLGVLGQRSGNRTVLRWG
jgi:general secretion pathway protein N